MKTRKQIERLARPLPGAAMVSNQQLLLLILELLLDIRDHWPGVKK